MDRVLTMYNIMCIRPNDKQNIDVTYFLYYVFCVLKADCIKHNLTWRWVRYMPTHKLVCFCDDTSKLKVQWGLFHFTCGVLTSFMKNFIFIFCTGSLDLSGHCAENAHHAHHINWGRRRHDTTRRFARGWHPEESSHQIQCKWDLCE